MNYRKAAGQNPPVEWLMRHAGVDRTEAEAAITNDTPLAVPSTVYRPVPKPLEAPSAPKSPKPSPPAHAPRLSQPFAPGQGKSAPRKRRGSPLPTVEGLVLRFTGTLQYIAFLFGAIADLGMAVFFFAALGPELVSQVVFGVYGAVQTGGKLWGWTNCRINRAALSVAIFAAVMSVFAVTSITRAEFQLQAINTASENARITQTASAQTPEQITQARITDKQADITKAAANRDAAQPAPHADGAPIEDREWRMYNQHEASRKGYEKELASLQGQLGKDQEAAKTAQAEAALASAKPVVRDYTLRLDANRIFAQWTSLGATPAECIGSVFSLLFAVLLELLIFATIPRKQLLAK